VSPWLALAKPRITVMVALCAAAGYALAADGPLDWARLGWTLLGVSLASAATGCLNQVLEAEADGRMTRTARRPLPAGLVSPGAAHLLGLLWGGAGLALLAWKSGTAACALTAFTLASYLLVYTPMKRFSPASTWVGAVPGALPPVIGWAAAGAPLDERAAALFAIQFLWQLPHFLALGWLYREDYAAGGFRIAAVTDPSGASTSAQLALSAWLLLAASLAPWWLGQAGALYLCGALLAGAALLWLSLKAAAELTPRSSRRVFLASLAYLPLVLGLLVAGRR
jgi:heme o synthase